MASASVEIVFIVLAVVASLLLALSVGWRLEGIAGWGHWARVAVWLAVGVLLGTAKVLTDNQQDPTAWNVFHMSLIMWLVMESVWSVFLRGGGLGS